MLAIPEIAILFIAAAPVLTLLALVDLLRRPTTNWVEAGQDRMVWALVVVFVAILGPVVYFAMGRPKLDAAAGTSHQSVVAP